MKHEARRFLAYGFPQSQWDSAKSETREILIQIASRRGGGVLSYSDLAARIRSIAFQPDDRSFHHLLGQISVEEDGAGRGMLSVVVVHAGGDFRPGPGFYALAQELGRDTRDREEFWIKESSRVYAAWENN